MALPKRLPRRGPFLEARRGPALEARCHLSPTRRRPVAGALPPVPGCRWPVAARRRPVAGPLPPVTGRRRPTAVAGPLPSVAGPLPPVAGPLPPVTDALPPHPRRKETSRAAQPSRAAPPCHPALPSRTAVQCPTASAPTTATAAFAATAATLATASTAAMASPTVLTFDAKGRAIDFDVWVDDLQLFLQCDSRDGVSLFDHTSGVSTAPTATADSTVCSQWTTRDAVARLAVRSHLSPAERAHFGQYKTAQSLYDAVVARYCPVLAHSSTVLPCPAAPSGLLTGLHLPSFSTNLVSGADLQDAWVDQFTPGGQRVTHYTCSQPGRHLTTFTRRPRSSLYTLTTAFVPVSSYNQVAASNQVFAAACTSSPASAPYSCRPLAHETLLWHHRLDHPSLPRLRGMASRALVSGLPRSLPSLPPGPAPTYVPCVEGRQRAAPHSSFPPTEAPLQTLHMDVWGPARVRGQGHERYFLLVVDDYSRYTTVFPLRSKGEVPEGIRQTFTLPASLQQNGIAEHRIGMVMDVALSNLYAIVFLLCDRADRLSLFDLTSGVSPALPATADSTVRSQWATRDAAARLAVRRHLPTTERAHFSQYRSSQTLYDAVVARYSSPATAALSRLFLPYLFPDLAAFPTVADLITHLRTSDARYRSALPP
ncbi:unnamed protein product, partial [Closterium sp. NIES-54]